MSVSSRNYSRACEILLNELEFNYIQQFYGEGTYIKIRDITFSPVKKTCLVDCVVVLGEIIETNILEDDMTRLLVYGIMDKLILDYKVNVMVKYES